MLRETISNLQSGIDYESCERLPLYKRDLKQMPIQIMDAETVAFLMEQGNPVQVDIEETCPNFKSLRWDEVEPYLPHEEWYLAQEHSQSIHGVRHLSRVVLNATVLTQIEGLDERERRIVCIASGMHDIGRLDDRTDPDHGLRSGLWLEENRDIFERRGIELSDKDVEEIKTICTYHEYNYEDIPEEVKENYGRNLDVLMHADMLDRYRLPRTKWWPREEFIRLPTTKQLLDIAKYLSLRSEEYVLTKNDDTQEAIRQAACEVGFLNPASEQEYSLSLSIESAQMQDTYALWQRTRSILTRLQELRNGHTLSTTNIEGHPVSPLSKNILGEEIIPDTNPLISLFENDPISNEVDPVEIAWQHHLVYETPNGHLFKRNSLFDQLKQGNGLTLVHITPALNKILQDGWLCGSGGCLGASIYTVPLRTDGRVHNLTRFILEEQMPKNPRCKTPEILSITLSPESCASANMEENWLDYLRFGEMQAEVFYKQLQNGNISSSLLGMLESQMIREINAAYDFLSVSQAYDLDSIGADQFDAMFNRALVSMPLLGYPYFETLLEYISLYQNDANSEKLAAQGELNTWNYFQVVFDLSPQLYERFKLQKFNPGIQEVADYLNDASQQDRIIRDFNQEHFFYFVKWRLAQYVRRRILGSKSLPRPGAGVDEILETNPSLLGHFIHRDLRKRPELSELHRTYEEGRAVRLWDYWNKKNILTPVNALLPKGETGINPQFENLSYKIHRNSIDREGYLHHEEKLDVKIADNLTPNNLSVLRPSSGSEN